ncbi:MAG: hypothetical protein UY74_C0006G0009 [Candidatus Kaiserbacteria bacterium GW2011_GWC2_52_8b]|uniref:PKD domain-containing protein n=2 Tax=Candidatus Kaiseribacteriota TaxID=1752734 RepID=A0A0G1XLR6_9BACT|nr:MAG: hypothetical protein UY67_C0034G0009 [Candidatus Kaiserbacteria bacterium GW2011_GWA2_52_12]KKW31810.1 MAG: hypothetical protein UY74_C0006G0009 [Candidatus Kaiserbacteria bacterium GW2011_GWC2_52_8b]
MKTYIVSAVIGVSLLGAGIASAQTYQVSYPGCSSIVSDLSYGSRGSQVSALQTYLVAQNYSGGGNWMLTGYYGQATTVAVRIFQGLHGLPQTGIADSATRAAMCLPGQGGGSYYGSMYGYNQNYAQNYTVPFNYYNTYPPPFAQGYSGTQYNYNYSYGYPWYTTGYITLTSLSPQSGPIGTNVIVYGYGFSAERNSVRFGNGVIADLRSGDGRTLTFTVPSEISGYGYQPIGLGSYNVSVTNALGQTSNAVPFTITSIGGNTGPISITSVNGPTNLYTGQTGTWAIYVNSPSNTQLTSSVRWGDENYYGYAAAVPQTTYSSNSVTFSHTYQNPGTYTVTFTVTNQNGQQNSSSVTVNVSYRTYY